MTVGVSEEESTSASDFNMEKAEALMMFETGKEKEVDEAGQNEINTELGRDLLLSEGGGGFDVCLC